MQKLAKPIVPSLLLLLLLAIEAAAEQPRKLALDVTKARPLAATDSPVFASVDLLTVKNLQAGKAPLAALSSPGTAEDESQRYIALHVEFQNAEACASFEHPQATVITRFERFADIFIPTDVDVFEEVSQLPGVAWVDIGECGVLPPPPRPVPNREPTRQIPERIVRGGYGKLKGKGVIVAIIDTGIDFRHPAFVTYDDQDNPVSRVLYYWDTASDTYANGVGQAAPVQYPNGAPIGTIYSRQDLTTELRSGPARIPVWDLTGHGTACAGIAAGNGTRSEGKYAGVAPEADIIAVRISSGPSSMMNLSYLVGAVCEWLEGVADQRPLVVSCSWGGQYGGRDGYLVQERQLDARFPLNRKGRAICFSAGNDGASWLHAGMEVKGERSPSTISWNAPGGGAVEVFVQTSNERDLFVGTLEQTKLEKVDSYIHGLSGHVVIEAMFASGDGGLFLYSGSGNSYVADAYIYGKQQPATFSQSCFSLEKQVGAPGTTTNAITVGSYDWNDQFSLAGKTVFLPDYDRQAPLQIGALSTYSSPGPLRTGEAMKPELTAPGQWFTAAAPCNVMTLRDSSGLYQAFNGTSAAAPYVAGIVALMLEQNPDLTLGEIKAGLRSAASRDQLTGEVPNGFWGYGKLDFKAVQRLFDDANP